MAPWLTVVGIGEDGFSGLGKQARRALLGAARIFGSPRQLALLPRCVAGERLGWPSPFSLAPVLALRGEPVCVLASGDPMFYGVGASLARQLPAAEIRVLSMPSSCALAAARLGWPLQDVQVVSLVARPLAALNAHLHSGVRLLVLSNDGDSPAAIATQLRERGFGPSRLRVFEHLGGVDERELAGTAQDWPHSDVAALNLVAIECLATSEAPRLHRLAGLPDSAFRHDGQLTKRDVRASYPGPPGTTARRTAVGRGRRLRLDRHRMDARPPGLPRLGHRGRRRPPGLHRTQPRCVGCTRPATGPRQGTSGRVEGLEQPDAVFIGGGVTREGVLDLCWANLRPGGRLVANAVTLQSELALAHFRERHGGELTRIHVAHAQPLGAFDTWRQALPITLLDVVKPADA
ncbi:precorrin-6y C5,15-methyltransferase (decarboxylating) CbiE subunit [Pseudomonas putida S11]|nr:precorrin-6y C5,15-methyltransferase (decarboxylating) CbiE subunit [Pseudomonas putida S11]